MGEEIRLQKLLSRAGVSSRRQAEELLLQGRVRVNGKVVTTLGTRADPERDLIEVDGRPIEAAAKQWIALHKPAGFLTSRGDSRGRRTVYDLLPEDVTSLAYVGRLDRETEGLLLFSNDGDVAHALLHPSSELDREYEVGVAGRPTKATLRRLLEGVDLEDGAARATTVRLLAPEGRGSVLSLVIREGRKREVRRMCEAVDHDVRWLRRVRFGPIRLGDLARGAWRVLGADEVEALRRRVRPPSGRGVARDAKSPGGEEPGRGDSIGSEE